MNSISSNNSVSNHNNQISSPAKHNKNTNDSSSQHILNSSSPNNQYRNPNIYHPPTTATRQPPPISNTMHSQLSQNSRNSHHSNSMSHHSLHSNHSRQSQHSNSLRSNSHHSHLSPENCDLPLPNGWEMARTNSGTIYYMDHNTEQTQWQHPALTNQNTNISSPHNHKNGLPPQHNNLNSPTFTNSINRHEIQKTQKSPAYTKSSPTHSNSRKNSTTQPNSIPTSHSHILSPTTQIYANNLPLGWEQVNDSNLGTYYINHNTRQTQYEHPLTLQTSHLNGNYPQENSSNPHNIISNVNHSNSLVNLPIDGEIIDIEVNKGKSFGLTIIGGDEPDTLIQVRNVVPNIPVISDHVRPGDVIVAVNNTLVIGWSHHQLVQLFNDIELGELTKIRVCRGYNLPDEEIDQNSTSPRPNSCHSAGQAGGTAGQATSTKLINLNITKGPQGFGFHFYKDKLTNSVQILTLTEQGKSNGLLENDVILKIDNKNVNNLNQNEILNLLSKFRDNSDVNILISREVSQDFPDHHLEVDSSRNLSGSQHISHDSGAHEPAVNVLTPNVETNFPDKHVILKRNRTGFGFRIKQGTKRTTIGEITPGGAADAEGTLKKGDEVVTLDGESILGMSGDQLIAKMQMAAINGTVSLGIRKPRRNKHSSNHSSQSVEKLSSQAINHPNSNNLLVLQKDFNSLNLQNHHSQLENYSNPSVHSSTHTNSLIKNESSIPQSNSNPLIQKITSTPSHSQSNGFNINLTKSETEGFGFVIVTNMLNNQNNLSKRYMHSIGNIVENSPSFNCGKLNLKDRIVSVNGTQLDDLDHNDVVNLIKLSKNSLFLGVIPYV